MAVERVRSCWGNYIWEKRRERERGKGRRLKDLISSIDCIASLFSTLAIHTHISPPYPYNSFSIFPCTRKWERECVSCCGPPIAAAAGHLLCNLDDHDYILFLLAHFFFHFSTEFDLFVSHYLCCREMMEWKSVGKAQRHRTDAFD